jgi:hypothetical protein
MLTADRPELARRAVECFRAQTYPAKRLLVYDTSRTLAQMAWYSGRHEGELFIADYPAGLTIGELRNTANALSYQDILIHWDSDDYSHPNRIAEQVAVLQSSGADAVGYNEMLFWDGRKYAAARNREDVGPIGGQDGRMIVGRGEAWLYSNPSPHYALGTSLCYWRKAWERRPFAALPLPGGRAGEDQDWLDGIASGRGPGMKLLSVSSRPIDDDPPMHINEQPRMIARIHGGNTSTAYDPALMRASEMQRSGWRRVPEWDSYCRGVMEVMEC